MNELIKSILEQSIDAGYLSDKEIELVKEFIRLNLTDTPVDYDSDSINF